MRSSGTRSCERPARAPRSRPSCSPSTTGTRAAGTRSALLLRRRRPCPCRVRHRRGVALLRARPRLGGAPRDGERRRSDRGCHATGRGAEYAGLFEPALDALRRARRFAGTDPVALADLHLRRARVLIRMGSLRTAYRQATRATVSSTSSRMSRRRGPGTAQRSGEQHPPLPGSPARGASPRCGPSSRRATRTSRPSSRIRT